MGYLRMFLAAAQSSIIIAISPQFGIAAEDAPQFTVELRNSDYGYLYSDSRWPEDSDETFQIPVCWMGDAVARFPIETAWVRESVENSWQKHSRLRFFGWGACAPSNTGIRIEVKDAGPRVTAFGRHIEGNDADQQPNRMYLNFTFETWSQGCRDSMLRESCIRSTAVHEFGHAIGFAHEQDRSDADIECQAFQFTGSSGAGLVKIGPYDPKSEMNYCNIAADGILSAGDIASVQQTYGMPLP